LKFDYKGGGRDPFRNELVLRILWHSGFYFYWMVDEKKMSDGNLSTPADGE
jgi:hypothetical protein